MSACAIQKYADLVPSKIAHSLSRGSAIRVTVSRSEGQEMPAKSGIDKNA
jgi:hypothetical protein